jgi:hypothetical protein
MVALAMASRLIYYGIELKLAWYGVVYPAREAREK